MAYLAVIGAGLAGISLAKRLTDAGHLCAVFEKSRGRGGRMSTRRMQGWQADHGAQYFTARTPEFRAEVEHWKELGWVAQWAIEPWKLDGDNLVKLPDGEQRYVGIPTMNAMVHGLSKDLNLYLETRIDRLERQGDTWRLWDEKGEHYGSFDAVLITAPLAQALALMPTGSSAEVALRFASMSPTWALSIAFAEKTGIDIDALFSNNGIISWLAKDSSKPNRPTEFETWVCHFSSAWTSNHLKASEQLLSHQAMLLLQQLTENALPEVRALFKHRWLYARSNAPEIPVLNWDGNTAIGLAGDWTTGSRIEDAWLSAMRLADQLIAEMSLGN